MRLAPLLLVLCGSGLPTSAQETVVIPKSRLEELERKEAELEKLKADLTKARDQNRQLQKQHGADAAGITSALPAEPVVMHASPPLASLPPLREGETVEAIDLANHYRADATAADLRYRNQKFIVRGEVARFEKPILIRDYNVILKTADHRVEVVCHFYPPEKYRAVLTVKRGSEIVGQLSDGSRLPLARIGDTIYVRGKCKGLRDSVVIMSGCEVKSGQ